MQTQTMASRAAFLRVTALSLVLLGACSERRDVGRHQPQIAASADSTRVVFQLRIVDGMPVPHLFSGEAGQCDEMIKGGTYIISGNSWSGQDIVERKCPEALAFRMSEPTQWKGVIRRSGDTLLFFIRDNSSRRELAADRGILRADTLVTRGEDYGPRRIYVRSTSP